MALFPVRRDAATDDFFTATARGEFPLIRDLQTGDYLDPRNGAGRDPDRYKQVVAAGTATIVSWSVPHAKSAGGTERQVVVGIVALTEGPWWWAELRGVDPDHDLTGRPVEVRFEKSGEGEQDEVVPYFVAAG